MREVPASRSRARGRVAAAAVVVVLLVEVLVRVSAGALPDPQVWSTPETQYKVDLMRDHAPVEVALVGSSVVDVSVDPAGLDRPAFNAALGAASLGMVADFTRAVVLPELDPEVVVVGVASRELNARSAGQADIEERFREAAAVREALGTESFLDRVARRAGDASALVRYRSVLRDPDTWLGTAPPSWGPELTGDDGLYLGFLDEGYHFDEAIARRLGEALHGFRVGDAQVETLRSLLAALRDQGRQVLLLATPVTADYVDLHPGGRSDHDAFIEAITEVAETVDVAFADAGVWDDELFADPLHVNRAGSERLTALVRAELAQLRTGSR